MSNLFYIKCSFYLFLSILLIITSNSKSDEFEFNGINIKNPWIRSTLPNQYISSGFFEIKNKSNKDEILLNISSDFANINEIHIMTVKNDIMRMKKIEKGIIIKSGTSIIFKPGNLHLMFKEVKYQLIENTIHNITFNFKNTGPIKIPVKVKDLTKKSYKNKHKH